MCNSHVGYLHVICWIEIKIPQYQMRSIHNYSFLKTQADYPKINSSQSAFWMQFGILIKIVSRLNHTAELCIDCKNLNVNLKIPSTRERNV